MNISLRSITNTDLEFLWRLHNLALKKYIEETWGWDEEWQRRHFDERFDPNNGRIIVVNGADAGYWWVNERPDEIFLVSIHLLPEFQRRGIGTRLIRSLIDNSYKAVRLKVLKVNPARRLYERLGFSISGDLETHFEMTRPPDIA
jgi:ribosomal protein S18 acetylase RimI-like enzyme